VVSTRNRNTTPVTSDAADRNPISPPDGTNISTMNNASATPSSTIPHSSSPDPPPAALPAPGPPGTGVVVTCANTSSTRSIIAPIITAPRHPRQSSDVNDRDPEKGARPGDYPPICHCLIASIGQNSI